MSIIQAFGGVADSSLVAMGLAYKSQNGTIYLASNDYCRIVISLGFLKMYKGVVDTLDFTNLETLCDFVISAVCHGLKIPAITERIVQNNYNVILPTSGVVLVRLKVNHPAIDFLVIDNSNCKLYMVQTSFQKYADRDIKYDAIHSLEIQGMTVHDYYREKTRYSGVTYIYATFRPTAVRDSPVTVLPLNHYPELLQVISYLCFTMEPLSRVSASLN